MVEVSEIGLKEDEIELDLGLSIGGSFRRAEKFKPVKKIRETIMVFPSIINAREAEEEVDPQTKREIQALKRKEAKRKREEKQLQQQQKNKKKHESQMENQASCKRDRTDSNNIGSACVDIDQMVQRNESANPASYSAIAPVQYPYAPVPFTNGLGFPCVTEKNGFFQPTACRSFRPYQGNRKTTSNASPLCSSSAGSDHYTSSHEGGGSSDSRSHSSYSLQEQHRLNGQKANYSKGLSEYSASSHSVESNHGNTDRTNHIEKDHVEKVVSSNITQPSPTGPKEEATSLTEAVPTDKCISTTENSSPGLLKETKIDEGNPSKPETQTPCLPQMPYVSTTGNGPNGKTVTGFLYRYSKSEVSIVCVCHGSTFSPAEFVQHAGGTDVSNPLKHITVIPYA